jgi:hypothetical protein
LAAEKRVVSAGRATTFGVREAERSRTRPDLAVS